MDGKLQTTERWPEGLAREKSGNVSSFADHEKHEQTRAIESTILWAFLELKPR